MYRKKLLLHCCCAPDSTVPLEDLLVEGYNVTLYWYGANIHPAEEETRRRRDLLSLASRSNSRVIVEDTFSPPWMEASLPFAEEPEGGRRCGICFRLQLEGAARAAVRLGIGTICTTLTISPHKDEKLINSIGAAAAENHGLAWLPRVFRKKNGFIRSVALSKEFGLYRQSYCGCIFSIRRGEDHEPVSGGETSPGPA